MTARAKPSYLSYDPDAYAFDPEHDFGELGSTLGNCALRIDQRMPLDHDLVVNAVAVSHLPEYVVDIETTITNAAVRDAPVFAEIADSFIAFMGDAIFVAHTLTTVSSPTNTSGSNAVSAFRSFALVPACVEAIWGTSPTVWAIFVQPIGSENHHRALCDTRAAAQLLNLINGKRALGQNVLAVSITEAA